MMGLTLAVLVMFRWGIDYAYPVIPVNNAVFFPCFVKPVFLKCIKRAMKIPLQDPNNVVFAKPKNKHPCEKKTVKKSHPQESPNLSAHQELWREQNHSSYHSFRWWKFNECVSISRHLYGGRVTYLTTIFGVEIGAQGLKDPPTT